MQKHSSRYYFIIVAAIAAVAGLLFGFDTGVISGAILFISEKFHLSAQMNGLVVSSVLIGALMGAIISGRITDIFGRKNLLIVDALIFIIGTLISALAWDVTSLIIGRIIVGVAIGIASYSAPLYISEMAPKKYRGALVSLNQLAIAIGILASYIVDYIFSHWGAWRVMLAVGVVPAVFLFIGMLFLPYSPRWMVLKGRKAGAFNILKRLRNCEVMAQEELDQIEANLLSSQKGSWKMLFSPKIRIALLIGVGLAVMQQVTGINTLLYYAPTIFKMAGFSGASGAILATTGIGVVFVLCTCISMAFLDMWGRRPLLYLGLVLMSVSLGALALVFHYSADYSMTLRLLTLVSMLVYVSGFAISLGPIMWLLITEIFPLNVRAFGASVCTCMNWAANWVVAFTFLSLVQFCGLSSTFLIYLVFSLLSLAFIYYLVPETKGCSLEHIEANLYVGRRPRDWGAQ